MLAIRRGEAEGFLISAIDAPADRIGAMLDTELVRGHPAPVFDRKAETDANYERLSETLIANWQHLRPAIASHSGL